MVDERPYRHSKYKPNHDGCIYGFNTHVILCSLAISFYFSSAYDLEMD